jgi:hypothetical protein
MTEPSFNPADQVTTAEEFPRVAETLLGAPGSVLGVTEEEAEEDAESPALFLATTVKVRGIPLVSPVRVAVKTFPTVKGEPIEGVTM